MVKFDKRIVAKIFIFQLVNFDYFFSQKWPFFSHLTIQLVICSLLLEIVKFDLSLVARILIFQLVNFDYFLALNDYLTSEKRTRWIVRVEKKGLILDSDTKLILENVITKNSINVLTAKSK